MDYRKILFDNWGIKLISLGLAILLWFNITSKGKMEVALTVPLELKNIPAGMALVGDVPGYLEVRLQGQERVLRDIATAKRVFGALDLSLAKDGENTVRISPDDITRPSGIAVTHLSPYEIKVRLEPILHKTIRLIPALHGVPAPGYRVASTTVIPARIVIEGPSGVVKPLTALQTMPIDIAGASSTITVAPKLDYAGKPVKLLDKDVSVRIVIERVRP
jgi:YbbR domain-containing protein